MARLAKRIVRFLKSEDGPTAVEYAVMLMLIFLVCIAVVVTLGQATEDSFEHSGKQIIEAFEPGR